MLLLQILLLVSCATDNMEDNKFTPWHYLFFGVIPLSSIFYYIKYLNSAYVITSFLLYVFISFIVMALLWKLISIMTLHWDIKKHFVIFVIVAFLVTLDHLIKLVLLKIKFETSVIGDLVLIKHRRNLSQNGILNFLNIETSRLSMIVFKVIIIAAIICCYNLFKSQTAKKAYTLIAAGAVSNLLDSVFYGYTLDYIHFHKIVTYDLKDYYVDTGVSVIILLIFLSEIKKSKEKKDR